VDRARAAVRERGDGIADAARPRSDARALDGQARGDHVLRDRALDDRPVDDRAPAAIGRDARLELAFERRRGRTVIAHAYCEPPFRIGRCLALDEAAYVIVACSGPGVFAGDRLRQSIRVGSGARVVLTSQSALQAHPGPAPAPAIVEHRYTLDEDAELHVAWDPLIPFAGARIAQRFDLAMPSSARLAWSDALMAGRVSRGESWRFRELAHELRLRIDGRVAYLERYRLAPDDRDVTRAWMAGGATYLATGLVHHDRANADTAQAMHDALANHGRADSAHAMHDGLADRDTLRAAVDLVEPRLIVTRMMATRGASFAAARSAWRRLILDAIFESPRLVGRKSV
jgi:urease accessory protein UreH